MADGHGGYRRPSNPAPVSGPGKLSKRTDGGPIRDLPNAEYGANQEFTDLQRAAPVAASGGITAPSGQPAEMPTGLGADTQFPGQPVTAGAAAGAGPGMEALGLPPGPVDEVADLRHRYGAWLPVLIRKADHPSSSQEFRDQVRYLVSKIG